MMSSPIAIGVVTATAWVDARKASGESFTLIQPSFAAQLVTVSGALVRGPAVLPSRKAISSVRRESAGLTAKTGTPWALASRTTCAPARTRPKKRRNSWRADSVKAP